jgi:hypothetical protein
MTCAHTQGGCIIRASFLHDIQIMCCMCSRVCAVQGGCIIRASFLDEIRKAYERNPELANLLVDPQFAQGVAARDAAWRRVVRRVCVATLVMPAPLNAMGLLPMTQANPWLHWQDTWVACSMCLLNVNITYTHTGRAGVPCRHAWCTHAWLLRISLLFRHLPPRPPASQPGAGACAWVGA